MPCTTKLYERIAGSPPRNHDLRAPRIELVAVDQTTFVNCSSVQTNTPLSAGGHGAVLTFPVSPIVYQVSIVDRGGTYAGARVPNLNGAISGDIDVVLYRIPPTGLRTGAGRVGGAAQVRAAILTYTGWSIDEKVAVFSLLDALSSLRGVSVPVLLTFIVTSVVSQR